MKTLIIGGASSGKSEYGEELVCSLNPKHYYIATMIPFDEEDNQRINNHKMRRINRGFITLEIPYNISNINVSDGAIFIDSLTSLVLNEMYQFEQDKKIVDYQNELFNELIDKIIDDFTKLFKKYQDIVIISDDIFSNIESINDSFTAYTKTYLYVLGNLHQKLAKMCDEVIRIQGTLVKKIKG